MKFSRLHKQTPPWKPGCKIVQPTPRWAYFVIVQARAELHRPGQTTKSAKQLVNLVVWSGLCSSALAWTMMKYAHLRVGWTILCPGFHGGVRLSGTHFLHFEGKISNIENSAAWVLDYRTSCRNELLFSNLVPSHVITSSRSNPSSQRRQICVKIQVINTLLKSCSHLNMTNTELVCYFVQMLFAQMINVLK